MFTKDELLNILSLLENMRNTRYASDWMLEDKIDESIAVINREIKLCSPDNKT